MRESALERLLIAELSRAGGVAYKLDSRARRGAPDRVVTLRGWTGYVELKTETGTVAPIQAHEHGRIAAAGGDVLVLRGADEVRRFCRA